MWKAQAFSCLKIRQTLPGIALRVAYFVAKNWLSPEVSY